MSERTWRDRVASVWTWARRMVTGVPGGGVVRLADQLGEGSENGRATVSIVLGQWPGRRVGDAVVSDRIAPAAMRRLVASADGSGLSGPDWRVHGLETVPRGTDEVARWLIGLAEASRGGAIVVDTAEMDEKMRGELAAHLGRLAPRADVEVREDNGQMQSQRARRAQRKAG